VTALLFGILSIKLVIERTNKVKNRVCRFSQVSNSGKHTINLPILVRIDEVHKNNFVSCTWRFPKGNPLVAGPVFIRPCKYRVCPLSYENR